MNAKNQTRRFLCGNFFVMLTALALPVGAEAAVTTITNTGRTTAKVCVYKATDHVMLVALECWTLPAGNTARWTHGRDSSTFNVAVYQPSALDGFLCSAKNLSSNLYVTASPCRILTFDPAITARLRVCNRSTTGTVSFALGYPAGRAAAPGGGVRTFHAAEGWWSVEQGECVLIPLNDRMPQQFIARAAQHPESAELYIYGETGIVLGFLRRVWEGGSGEPSACVDGEQRFAIPQWLFANRACAAPATKRVRMTRIDPPSQFKAGLLEYYWDFTNSLK